MSRLFENKIIAKIEPKKLGLIEKRFWMNSNLEFSKFLPLGTSDLLHSHLDKLKK